jgi:hypothetical protein
LPKKTFGFFFNTTLSYTSRFNTSRSVCSTSVSLYKRVLLFIFKS